MGLLFLARPVKNNTANKQTVHQDDDYDGLRENGMVLTSSSKRTWPRVGVPSNGACSKETFPVNTKAWMPQLTAILVGGFLAWYYCAELLRQGPTLYILSSLSVCSVPAPNSRSPNSPKWHGSWCLCCVYVYFTQMILFYYQHLLLICRKC